MREPVIKPACSAYLWERLSGNEGYVVPQKWGADYGPNVVGTAEDRSRYSKHNNTLNMRDDQKQNPMLERGIEWFYNIGKDENALGHSWKNYYRSAYYNYLCVDLGSCCIINKKIGSHTND